MNKARIAIVTLSLLTAMTAASGEGLDASGSAAAQRLLARHATAIEDSCDVAMSVASVGSEQAMLDLVRGKVRVAAISGPLEEALAGARRQAAAAGQQLAAAAKLNYHAFAPARDGEPALGFVTVGAPSPEVQKVLMYLRSQEGRALIASR